MVLVAFATSVLLNTQPMEADHVKRIFHDNLRYYWSGSSNFEAVTPDKVRSSKDVAKRRNRVTVYFDFDSDVLKEGEKRKLRVIKKGDRVFLEGYASPEGSKEYNLGLSKRRAKRVADFLKKKGTKIEGVRAYGEEGCNLAKEEWWKCRKVEIRVR